jgi:hypothetical protein
MASSPRSLLRTLRSKQGWGAQRGSKHRNPTYLHSAPPARNRSEWPARPSTRILKPTPRCAKKSAWGGEMSETAAEEFGLLPGEQQTSSPEDAQHWITVYQELIEFCELMLTSPGQSLEAGHLRRRLIHYQWRLRCWQEELARAR